MSAAGEGGGINLNKEGETPTATLPEGIPSSSPSNKSDSCSLQDVDRNTTLTPAIKADNPSIDHNLKENTEELDAVIEKKLQSDKEKALDFDSELDFELKWDDDDDPNDDQAAIDDIDIDRELKEIESTQPTLKTGDNEAKETQNSLTTLETGELVSKIDDSIADKIDSSIAIDSNIEANNAMDVNNVGEEIKTTDNEPDILNNELNTAENELLKTDESDNVDNDLNSEKDYLFLKTDEPKNVDNVLSRPEDDLSNTPVAGEKEVDSFNVDVDTSAKVDIETKASSTESETNSLDEQLIYSDVDVPDIEDKELMDEIDAQITESEKTIDTLEDTEKLQALPGILNIQKENKIPEINEKEEATEKDLEINLQVTEPDKSIDELKHTEKLQVLPELLISEKENEPSKNIIMNEKEIETSEKDIVDEMDVDDVLDNLNQTIEKSDPSDTLSSVTDMETSSYNINKEHRLDKPDVMIEIPTQELIESFDDLNETSNTAEGSSEKLNNQTGNDVTDDHDFIESITPKAQNLNLIESHEIEKDTNINNTILDKDDNANNTVDKLLTGEISNAVDTGKAKGKASDTVQTESMDIDSKVVFEITEKPIEQNISEPDCNLETIKPDEESTVTTLDKKITHADVIFKANSEEPKVFKADDVTSPAPQNSEKDLKLNKEAEKVESSGNLQPKEVEEVQNKPTQFEEAGPSTSKYHQELSDEDQEVTDSLGLLAESSRVMEDDDEQEQENEPDDDDDDDDFDQDDESNQMTTEHSEDSNAQQSETDVPKGTMEVDESNDAPDPNNLADAQDMEETGDVDDSCYANEADEPEDESRDVDESSAEKGEFQFQIGEVVSEKAADTVTEKSMEAADETEKAVEALLQDELAEESADVPQAAESIETDKQSDFDSDGASSESSKLRQLLQKDNKSIEPPETEKKSPSKTKKLEISKPKHEINIVELEESSSEDDIQVVNKRPVEAPASPKDVTSVKIPDEIEVMSAAAGDTSDMTQKPGEVVISGLPKPAAHKPARLNTDEVTIKSAGPTTEPLVIPETMAPKTPEAKTPIDLNMEIFSLDSDDEEMDTKSKRKKKLTAVEIDKARETNKCINANCTSDASVPLVPASVSAAVYYAANPQKGSGMCINCAKRLEERSEKLIQGVKDLTPFLNMEMCMIREEFVEISDSDSDGEIEIMKKDDEIIGEKGAKLLEDQLAEMFNDTWKKYDMEARLLTAQTEINLEVRQLEEECKKIDAMLNECQTETDKFRNKLYDTFADERKELPPITIYDTPLSQWCGLEDGITTAEVKEVRPAARRAAAAPEPAARRAAIPLGYAPLDADPAKPPKPAEPKPVPSPPPVATPAPTPTVDVTAQNEDDNADISVVKLCVEAAPAGLPPPGAATRPALRPHMQVYAMRNSFGAWHKVTITEVLPKVTGQFTTCRVRFEQPKNVLKLLPARCLAYEQPPDVRLTIGTRVIALFKDHRFNADPKHEVEKKEAYYSGIVAEIPNPVNSFRYLIFFDDGYAQYVQHSVTRLVCECAPRVWDEVHPFSRQFVRDYLRAYPERPMVRLHAGQSIKTEWNGKWWVSKVLQVDASLVHVHFEGKKEGGIDKTEWIYRGSTRLAPLYLELQAAERQRSRPLPRAQAGRRFNMPYVEYTRSDEQADKAAPAQPQTPAQTQAQIEQEIRRQRAVAKKSTTQPPQPPPARDNVTSRVVFYTPKNAIKPHKMVPHTCGPRCKRTDVLALKDLRTYNPLTKPLLSGWERQQVRYRMPAVKAIMYRAPCGRRIRDYKELHQYLQAIESDMGVDLFDFNPSTHCLAEFLLNKCLISKKDLSHGKENVPVPCVNYYDDSLPEFCSYNTERTPTAGVPLNIDPEFLCGCDCTDDCADKTKCACWKMTLEGARTIGLDTNEVGYVYKRLPEPLPSGIYECNVRCKCKQTCLNRVAQHPLQLKLQVFKTANRGWGIRALNDVPKGAFLCVYAGNLLTDATANLDGLNEGDEYLAELDYIEVVEQMKEGFEEDIPEDAKKLDQEESESSSMSASSSDEEPRQDADDDFRPALPGGLYTPSEYSKRLRKREKSKKAREKEEKEKKEKEQKEKDGNTDDCITISDDEELREPARFAAQAGMGGKEFISKYKSVRAHFGKDEACYIMDAKVQGNIGRYLNHSCTPNVFVQNVFVDTHDPRFPWVAFFALSQIRAGTELTWNYNYDVGSVPGKVLYCYCNAPNCRGRLL